jgi:hypothetical protein
MPATASMPRYGAVSFIHGQMSHPVCPRLSIGLGLMMWWNLMFGGFLSPWSRLSFAKVAGPPMAPAPGRKTFQSPGLHHPRSISFDVESHLSSTKTNHRPISDLTKSPPSPHQVPTQLQSQNSIVRRGAWKNGPMVGVDVGRCTQRPRPAKLAPV